MVVPRVDPEIMDTKEILTFICERLRDAAATKGAANIEVTCDTTILEGGLPVDSLDLAAIVVELEGLTGRDPFRDGFVNFRTVAELARLYSGTE